MLSQTVCDENRKTSHTEKITGSSSALEVMTHGINLPFLLVTLSPNAQPSPLISACCYGNIQIKESQGWE